MDKEFVPYELAVKLKELGFECDYSFKEYDTKGYLQQTGLLSSHDLPHVDAPLWQQAFDWFRIIHNFNHLIWVVEGVGSYEISKIDSHLDDIPEMHMEEYFTTYEEARIACLEKLIEIIENG